MTDWAHSALRLAGLGIIVAGCGLAIAEWVRLGSDPARAGRREGTRYTLAALVLLAGASGLSLAWDFSQGRPWHFYSASLMWLIQILCLRPLVQMGYLWARPFGVPRKWMWPWKKWPWTWLGGWILALLGWTALLSRLIPHHTSPELIQRLGLDGMPPWLQAGFILLLIQLAPILEECLFRHYLLYRLTATLSRGPAPAAVAIALTSLLWSIAHTGMVEPWWLKHLQTVPTGVILGLTARRHGLAIAIVLHGGFNLGLFVFGPWVS